MVAFIGMGLLGSNFVKSMLKRGIAVQVWNRTPERAQALEAFGAKAFAHVSDAVKGATRVHITLVDDAVVDEVLAQAEAGLTAGTIIIDHTTTSAPGAAKRAAAWQEKGFYYLHAPVFMGPINALESTGVMMASGDEQLFKQVEAELSAMTGRLVYLGAKPQRAAGMKLMGNLFLISITSGLSDTFGLAKSLGMPGEDVLQLFDFFNPGPMVPARAKRILNAQFDEPSWELKMARKDARLMIEQAASQNIKLPATAATAQLMDEWIAKGMGSKDWNIIASDNL